MKILVLAHGFPNACDPISGIFVLEQIKALGKQGVECVVVSPSPWAPPLFRSLPRVGKFLSIPRRTMLDGFRVEHPRVMMPPNGWLFSLYGLLFYLRCRQMVGRYVAEEKIDLIHAHTVMPDGFAAVLLGRQFRIPVVCTAHGSEVRISPQQSRATRWATKWALRRLSHLIAVSEDLKGYIFKLIGDRQVEVVKNGADRDQFKSIPKMEARERLGISSDKKVVLFIGNLAPVKGVEFLLEAVSRLARKDVRIYLVGEGELKEKLASMSSQLGLDCTFAGKRPHDEVPSWLCAADCVVLPSLSEGLPTIAVEAMMCRAPLVATAVGGTPEVVKDGETGLLVPPRDPASLAQAISRILDDPKFSAALAAKAEQAAKSELTWEANARKTIAVYQDALAQTKSHTCVRDNLESVQCSTVER